MDNDEIQPQNTKTSEAISELIKEGKLKEAELLVRESLSKDPDSRIYMGQLIGILIRQNKLIEAERLTSKSLIKDPNDSIYMSQLINILVKQGRLEKAERLARESLEKNPNDIIRMSQLISIATKQGKLEKAERLARESLIKGQNDKTIIDQLISILVKQNKLAEATLLATELSKRYPTNRHIREKMTNIQKMTKNYSGSKVAELSSANARESLYDSTIEEVKEQLDKNPDDIVSSFKLVALYQIAGFDKVAAKICKAVVKREGIGLEEATIFNGLFQITVSKQPIQSAAEAKTVELYKQLIKAKNDDNIRRT